VRPKENLCLRVQAPSGFAHFFHCGKSVPRLYEREATAQTHKNKPLQENLFSPAHFSRKLY
jgi:hypothetical protein